MVILVLIVLGVCFGSFINALVWRLHQQATVSANHRKEYSISTGRSMCPHCKHVLATMDLIPILSWLSLKGRCRYCHKSIPDTPVPEIVLPILFVLSYTCWPLTLSGQGVTLFIFWLVFIVGLLALAIYDLRWYLLPNRIIFPLIGLALLQVCLQLIVFKGGLGSLLGPIWGVLIGGGIFWLLFQVSRGKWIGGGDVKLGALLGLILGGPAMSFLMIFGASVTGTIIALPLLALKRIKRTSRVPFGPFLIVSAVFVELFGAAIIAWYRRQLGI